MSPGTQTVLIVAAIMAGPPSLLYGLWWLLRGRKQGSWEMPKWLQAAALVIMYTLLWGGFYLWIQSK